MVPHARAAALMVSALTVCGCVSTSSVAGPPSALATASATSPTGQLEAQLEALPTGTLLRMDVRGLRAERLASMAAGIDRTSDPLSGIRALALAVREVELSKWEADRAEAREYAKASLARLRPVHSGDRAAPYLAGLESQLLFTSGGGPADSARAVELQATAAAQQPDSPVLQALALMARSRSEDGDVNLEADARALTTRFPRSAFVWLARSIVLRARQDLDAALGALGEAVRVAPRCLLAQFVYVTSLVSRVRGLPGRVFRIELADQMSRLRQQVYALQLLSGDRADLERALEHLAVLSAVRWFEGGDVDQLIVVERDATSAEFAEFLERIECDADSERLSSQASRLLDGLAAAESAVWVRLKLDAIAVQRLRVVAAWSEGPLDEGVDLVTARVETDAGPGYPSAVAAFRAYLLARTLLIRGRPDDMRRARALFRVARGMLPWFPLPAIGHVEADVGTGDPIESPDNAVAILNPHSALPQAWMAAAILARERGDFRVAAERAARAADLAPDSPLVGLFHLRAAVSVAVQPEGAGEHPEVERVARQVTDAVARMTEKQETRDLWLRTVHRAARTQTAKPR